MEIQSNAGTRHYRSVEAGSEMGKKKRFRDKCLAALARTLTTHNQYSNNTA